MRRGHIDSVVSNGLVEGWALNEGGSNDPLHVKILDGGGAEIASGLANLYRKDLARAGLAFGWCFFKLKSSRPADRLRHDRLTLAAADDGATLFGPAKVEFEPRADHAVLDIAGLLYSDPTVLRSLDEIEGCDTLFSDYITGNGVDAFVRTAYAYVLGREIDEEGFAVYSRLVEQKQLAPYAMLRTLADSPEFRSKNRVLAAPNAPNFPFRSL